MTHTTDRALQRVRYALHFRQLHVVATERVTPHMVFVTLTGDDLEHFESRGFDDHVKLLFAPLGEKVVLPALTAQGPVWPKDGPRPMGRDYTPLHFDAKAQTLQLAFALHEAGPATQWALQAKPGDVLHVAGPRGSILIPLDFDGHVLVGDDTAIPAIMRRLADLPAQAQALVLIEVEDETARLDLPTAAQADIHWVYRRGQRLDDPQRLLQALKQARWPTGDTHAWIACESSIAKALRTCIVTERAHPAKWIKASGYWRLGDAGAHEEHAD